MAVPTILGIALPYYAVPDEAWLETILHKPPLPADPNIYTVPGLYIDLLFAATKEYNSGAVVANRGVILQAIDPQSQLIWEVGAAAVQPAGLVGSYSWNVNCDVAYSLTDDTGGMTQTLPLPMIPLLPGSKLSFNVRSQQAGDTDFAPVLTLLHIPTGPDPSLGAAVAPLPTPVLL